MTADQVKEEVDKVWATYRQEVDAANTKHTAALRQLQAACPHRWVVRLHPGVCQYMQVCTSCGQQGEVVL